MKLEKVSVWLSNRDMQHVSGEINPAVGQVPALGLALLVELVEVPRHTPPGAWRPLAPGKALSIPTHCSFSEELQKLSPVRTLRGMDRCVWAWRVFVYSAVQLVCRPGGSGWFREVSDSLPLGFLCVFFPLHCSSNNPLFVHLLG